MGYIGLLYSPVGYIGLLFLSAGYFSLDGLDANLLMLCHFPAHYKNYQYMPSESI